VVGDASAGDVCGTGDRVQGSGGRGGPNRIDR
jgi:hypothetical protein